MVRALRNAWVVAAGLGIALGGIGMSAARAQAKPDAKGVEFFENKIRPILAKSCIGCHGPEKQKAGLRMDTRDFLLAGTDEDGKRKKVVEPGNPDKSIVIEAVLYKNEDIQMPPPKKKQSMKLAQAEIDALVEWVKLGVPYGEKPVEAAAAK